MNEARGCTRCADGVHRLMSLKEWMSLLAPDHPAYEEWHQEFEAYRLARNDLYAAQEKIKKLETDLAVKIYEPDIVKVSRKLWDEIWCEVKTVYPTPHEELGSKIRAMRQEIEELRKLRQAVEQLPTGKPTSCP